MTIEKHIFNICLAICIFAGVLIGLSYGDGVSNHATYIPPGLQWAEPDFLKDDWWLSNVVHYHWAFFSIVALLSKLNILQWGLAILNVSIIAGSLYFCLIILRKSTLKHYAKLFLVFVTIFLLSNTFKSVAATYLFSPSLQASSVATFATIAAFYFFLNRRYIYVGIYLAIGGIFHTNFLLVNITVFCFAYFLGCLPDWNKKNILWRQWSIDLLSMLGLSILIAAISLPFILNLTIGGDTKEVIKEANSIFFNFAVPFHYRPETFLIDFIPLFSWQLLGLSWTNFSFKEAKYRRQVWILQLSIFVILIIATLLTTVVFIESVSRLFFWRLAPFSILLSTIMLLSGTIRAATIKAPSTKREKWIPLIVSGIAVLLLARFMQYQYGISKPFVALQLIFVLTCISLPALAWTYPQFLKIFTNSVRCSFAAHVFLLILFGYSAFLIAVPERYPLIITTQKNSQEEQLFMYVKTETPMNAQFLIPPDLKSFRLFAERAIVVDLKALPFDKLSLIDWYQRLGNISGIQKPKSKEELLKGYYSMDTLRLNTLRKMYLISHAVLLTKTNANIESDNWVEIFKNDTFRVLKFVPKSDI